ncbi:signal peptidase I [Bacillus andreraoultii]|uniref:signal peptidase I n=1 Tax=Bacillus andreraoultii TaxID=1499685 RepID=UPI00053971B1|nr:signal peptidase I [Bacillus andreraoultii]
MDNRVSDELLSWIKSILIALVVVFLCRKFLFVPSTVYGESMEPTFSSHDRIIIGKNSEIERFDVIVLNAPNSDEQYIKRVIGLPGDKIEMKNDNLYINGKIYDEPYLKSMKAEHRTSKITEDFTLKDLTGETVVPKNSLFVLGDNRLVSRDSRRFGFISFDQVVGEVKFRFYPFDEIGKPN